MAIGPTESAVLEAALAEAIRLGHQWAGPPHILIALLDERRPSVAKEVLHALGVRRGTIEHEAVRRYGCTDRATDGRSGATTDILWHETSGRVQGLAAALGTGVISPEHVLIALVWQPRQRWLEDLLVSVGTSRDAVVAELAGRGVPVPVGAPPRLHPPKTQAAAFPKARLHELNWALRERADFDWGIGRDKDDPDTMIVLAAAHIELDRVLDDVVGSGLWQWRKGGPEK